MDNVAMTMLNVCTKMTLSVIEVLRNVGFRGFLDNRHQNHPYSWDTHINSSN